MRKMILGCLLFLLAVRGLAYAEATDPAVRTSEEKRPAGPAAGPEPCAAHGRPAQARPGPGRQVPAGAGARPDDGGLPPAGGTGAEGRGLRRLGLRRRQATDRPHRGTLPLGRQPDVRRHGRRALQGAGGLPRQGDEGGAGQARQRLPRRADGRPGHRRRDALSAGGAGRHPLGRLRPQRHVVAVVHAAQDLRRPARRLSLHRQQDRAGGRDQVRRLGRGDCREARPTPRSSGCSTPSSAA